MSTAKKGPKSKGKSKSASKARAQDADRQDGRQIVPLLPLRDIVIFPHMVVPFFVGREKSINALEAAMKDKTDIFLCAQKAGSINDPGPEDIYHTGTLANILQLVKLPDGTLKVLVEGKQRARVT